MQLCHPPRSQYGLARQSGWLAALAWLAAGGQLWLQLCSLSSYKY